jgi:hypothetical protein
MNPYQTLSRLTNDFFFLLAGTAFLDTIQLNGDISEPSVFLVVYYEDFELERIWKEAGRGVLRKTKPQDSETC